MFPPFVESFGDQFFAVMINLVGTILTTLFGSLTTAFASTVVVPLFEGIAQSLGITPAA